MNEKARHWRAFFCCAGYALAQLLVLIPAIKL